MAETRFYRHYKNKPYKYLGLVRHSETLEELVLYETLYENENGKIWARPKDMFFEKIIKDNQQIYRFEPIDFKYIETEDASKIITSHLKDIFFKSLGRFDEQKIKDFLVKPSRHYLQLALEGDLIVGFKFGYAHDNQTFYSRYGGVLPKYQGLGIASVLLESQHRWCREQGFKAIQTKAKNCFPKMISLNLKNGFEIVGTETADGHELKIIFEKKI